MSTAERAPEPSFDEALRRFAELRTLDDERISNAAHSRLYCGERPSAIAVVLLHGYTNCPEQWTQFAEQLFDRGHNVVIPRLPGHGDADRSCARLARVSMRALLKTAYDAIDIARGIGERVVVAGLSVAAELGAFAAVENPRVARVLAIVPLFGLKGQTPARDALLGLAFGIVPNLNVPWDPFGQQHLIPAHAYPRFPSRGLAGALRFGTRLYASARRKAPRAEISVVLNANEPAVDNLMAEEIVRRWNLLGGARSATFMLEGLPANHDIIDPSNPLQRVDLVYPKLLELIEAPFAP